MRARIRARLRSAAGETLGETLLALLISALALTMLAGAISAAAGIVTRSNRQMAAYYGADNKLVSQIETSDEDGPYTYVPNNKVEIEQTGVTEPIKQTYSASKGFQNNAFPATPVTAYKAITGD